MKAIQVIKEETRYILTDGKYQISVIVSENATGGDNKLLSIYRHLFFNQGFDFIKSKPEDIKAIARLLLKASELK